MLNFGQRKIRIGRFFLSSPLVADVARRGIAQSKATRNGNTEHQVADISLSLDDAFVLPIAAF